MFYLTDRDKFIITEISRFRGCLGKQIIKIANFTSRRSCDQRLKKLIDNGYIERKRYVYGIAGVYRITNKAKSEIGVDLPVSNIRLEQLEHDLLVVDVYLFLKDRLNLTPADFTTEKELRHIQGFNTRTHAPDLIYKYKNKVFCVEVELSLKAKSRLEKNINNNYVTYNGQKWFIRHTNNRLYTWLREFSLIYSDIEIISIEVVNDDRNITKA